MSTNEQLSALLSCINNQTRCEYTYVNPNTPSRFSELVDEQATKGNATPSNTLIIRRLSHIEVVYEPTTNQLTITRFDTAKAMGGKLSTNNESVSTYTIESDVTTELLLSYINQVLNNTPEGQ